MHYIELIVLLAAVQVFFFGTQVGVARSKSGISPPKMTGDDRLERAVRVQMNTIESVVVFIPAFVIAARYWPALVVGVIGVVYLVGRMLFWHGYMQEASKRMPGFMMTFLSIAALVLLSLAGFAKSFL